MDEVKKSWKAHGTGNRLERIGGRTPGASLSPHSGLSVAFEHVRRARRLALVYPDIVPRASKVVDTRHCGTHEPSETPRRPPAARTVARQANVWHLSLRATEGESGDRKKMTVLLLLLPPLFLTTLGEALCPQP